MQQNIIILSLIMAGIGLIIFLVFGGANLAFLSQANFGVLTATVTINPLELEIEAPQRVELNKVFEVKAHIKNKGDALIKNGGAQVFTGEGLEVLGQAGKKIGVIPGGKEKKTTWRLKGIKEGNHIINVSFAGELNNELVRIEDSAKIEVYSSGSIFQRIFSKFLTLFY